MIWWGIFVYFIIFIFVISFSIKTTLFYSLKNNDGKLQVYLFNIMIFELGFKLQLDSIIIKRKNKITAVKFEDFGKSKFVDRFMIKFIKMVKINAISSDILIGVEGDSFYTNMLGGAILCLQKSALSIISTKRKIKVLKADVVQVCYDTETQIKLAFGISVCLLQIVASLILALGYKKGDMYGKPS